MAKQRSPEGAKRVKRVNARIGYTCLIGFVFVAAARILSGAGATGLAIAALIVGWCIWIYSLVLVFSKTRIH